MVVWSGYGLLTVLIAALGGVLGATAIQPALLGLAAGFPPGAGVAIGLLLAAVVNWFVGAALNRRPGRLLVDPRTGEQVVLRRRHTLFWLPMQYWSLILVVLAIAAVIVPGRTVTLPVGGTTAT